MISKELLSEVMGVGYEIEHIGTIEGTEIDEMDGMELLYFWYRNDHGSHKRYVNVYQLAHKCKEWAYKQGYMVFSGFDDEDQVWKIIDTDFTSHGEPEAIFKSCQWILENKQ